MNKIKKFFGVHTKTTEEEYVSSIIERRIKLIRQLMKQGWSRNGAVDRARYTYRF